MSIKFTEITEDELINYTELILKLDIDIYQTPQWLIINKESPCDQINCILIEFDNNIAFIPLIKRHIKNTPFFDLMTPYGYGGIAFSQNADQHFKENILCLLMDYLQQTDYVSIFLRLHPILNQDLKTSPALMPNGMTLNVPLALGHDTLFSRYRSGHRYDIRKNLKQEDIEVSIDNDFAHLDDFIDLYHQTMQRLNATRFYFFDKTYFYTMRALLADKLKLVVVKKANKVIGAALFLLQSNIIQYHLSGNSQDGRKYQPAKLIIDHMIQWGIAHNYKFLHLGGGLGGRKDELYKFKKGFAAEELDFHTARLVINQNVYELLCQQQGYDKQMIEDKLNFFPLYRNSLMA